ncbi:hypothetical protein FQN55_005337 [Onygenales sp. PD_40]|nr:hypothetical protein FQN55_005337 [Onygenales sp. PD_40]
MDYGYYSATPQQQYQLFEITHPPHTQADHFHPQPEDQHHFDPAFLPFDNNDFQFGSSALLAGHTAPSPDTHGKSVVESRSSKLGGSNNQNNGHPVPTTLENGIEDFPLENGRNRSSSEEKEMMTPAQSRRKEQNRAAQRAFRARKERRVRDLEQELTEYKNNFSSLIEDNESLKRQIAKFATENEILRATSNIGIPSSSSRHPPPPPPPPTKDPEPTTTGPMRWSPTDYTPGDKSPAHRVIVNKLTGERLLDASATWDLIVGHLTKQGVKLDVQDIYDRLRGRAQCDGQGPVIEEGCVLKAIEDSIAAGSDELI